MRMLKHRLVFHVAGILLGLLYARNGITTSNWRHLYVKTKSPDSTEQCPPTEVCHELSYYLQNLSYFQSSKSIFHFMSGVHVMNVSEHVTIQGVRNMTFEGSSTVGLEKETYWIREAALVVKPTTILQCFGPSGFVFAGVNNLTIRNILVRGCGGPLQAYHWSLILSEYTRLDELYTLEDHMGLQAAVVIVSAFHLTLQNVSIVQSTGYGLLGFNILGTSLISHTALIANNDHRKCHNQISCQGGNMLIAYAEPRRLYTLIWYHKLFIEKSVFLNGYDNRKLSAIKSDYFISGGSGIGLQITPASSYGIAVIMDDVISAGNKGVWIDGVNLCVRVFELTISYSIKVQHSILGYSRGLRNLEPHHYEHSKAVGCRYGIKLPLRPAHIIRFLLPISRSLHLIDSDLSSNSVTAIFIYQEDLQSYGDYGLRGETRRELVTRFEIINCTLKLNEGAIGSAMLIRQVNGLNSGSLEVVVRNSRILRNFNTYEPLFVTASLYPNPPGTSTVTLESVHNITFGDCTFANNVGTAISAFSSAIHFKGIVIFEANEANYGGGLGLHDGSIAYVLSGAHIIFSNNHAYKRGGAVFVSTVSSTLQPVVHEYTCFAQAEFGETRSWSATLVRFENNTANVAGSALYGGHVDSCKSDDGGQTNTANTSHFIIFGLLWFAKNDSDLSLISSEPERLCLCSSGVLTLCTEKWSWEEEYTLYPGQSFVIEAASAGQTNGLVPAVFYSTLSSPKTSHFGPLQDVQEVLAECRNLTYTVYTTESFEYMEIVLSTDSKLISQSSEHLSFALTMLNCPPGFWLSPTEWGCVCNPNLHPYNVSCDVNDQTIGRNPLLWISAHFIAQHEMWDLLIHEHCPFDYCDQNIDKFTLEYSDAQCAYGRSGTLCGGCSAGMSVVLGSSKCKHCPNSYLWLLIPLALAGIVLVLVLIALNFTVSVGTLNALIFYANVVWFNQSAMFSDWKQLLAPNKFLFVFLAFLNLDLGIETCFYDGMDMYGRVWLQFVFPLYIWFLVGMLIVLSKRSTLIVKLCGRNIISVLATLFLLSYAKLLRTVITILSFTELKYGDGTLSHAVWLYDGNVKFLEGKHLVLSLVALVVSIGFLLPYTLLLLFIPCLQTYSGHWILQWPMRYLMSLLDAYQAPYKTNFRYWTGVMLVLRNVLFLAFAVNSLGDPKINLAVISSLGLCLLTVTLLLGEVYQNKLLNILETWFILNLSVFAVWSLYVGERGLPNSSQAIVTFVMVGLAFLCFVFIAVYHTLLRLKLKEYWKPRKPAGPVRNLTNEADIDPQPAQPIVGCTVIELREPLLTDS